MDPAKPLLKSLGQLLQTQFKQILKLKLKLSKIEESEKALRKQYRKLYEIHEKCLNWRDTDWRTEVKKRIANKQPAPFQHAQNCAKQRKIPWTISEEEYAALIKNNRCHYCSKPLPKKGIKLDRLDSKLGYCPNNVVPCCTRCNQVKNWFLSAEKMEEIGPLLDK